MWCFDFAQYMKALVLRFPCNALTLSEKVACKVLESSKKGLGNFWFLAWSSVQSLNLTLFNNINLQQIFGSTTIFSLQMMKDNSWSLEVTQERVSIYPQRKVSWDLEFIAPVYACFLFYHSFTNIFLEALVDAREHTAVGHHHIKSSPFSFLLEERNKASFFYHDQNNILEYQSNKL